MNIGNENEYTEFKESTAEIKPACQSIAAILNRHGSGTVYFGVLDNGEIVGQQISKGTKREIVNAITQSVEPTPYFEVNILSTPEGKSFVEIPFKGNNAPYTCLSVFYIRVADADKKMDREMVREYFEQASGDYSRWENENSQVDKSQIDEKLVQRYFEKGRRQGKIHLEYTTAENVLRKLKLFYDETYLNNAGQYLFSTTKPVRLKLADFSSESRLVISNMLQFNGNIFECIEKAMQFISDSIAWRAVFTGAPERINLPEIPMEAVREIVVNAFAHGRYESNTSFEVEIFRNRVSIYSPGRFPRGATPEQFAFESREPIFMNPKIVDVLYKGDEIETLASGFERAFYYCKKAGTQYEYFFTDNGFRFVFYRGALGHVSDIMGEREKTIMNYLRNNPSMTAKELAGVLNVSVKTVQRSIGKMKNCGIIERIGPDNAGIWVIKENR